jgi:predicted Fe-Mo cluster-binding NifX family protein
MKIAFPANDKIIASHFRHCNNFQVFVVDNDKQIVNQAIIENPAEHTPGLLPQILQKHGIEIVVVDGIGQKAVSLFNEMGIQVIIGVSGPIDDALRSFLAGTLKGGENICSH